MLKVLHIIPSLGKGGAERITLDICTYLNRRPDVNVKLVVLGKLNEYPGYVKDLDIHFIHIDMNLSVWKKNELNLKELDLIIDEFAPDVIHTHLFIAELAGHARIRKGVRYISHFHNNVEQLLKPPSVPFTKKQLTDAYERRWLMKKYLEGDCSFICISKDSYTYFHSNLDPALHKRIHYLPNAVDTTRFSYKPRTGMNTPVNIINCGSFIPLKNQAFLLDCLAEIRKNGVDARLIFLGDGPEIQNVKNKAEALNLSQYTAFPGKVDHPEQYYRDADIYFHSSTHEAFGLVLIEAMLSGLPIVSLDGTGNRDILKEGENGFLIKEEVPALFYEKLKYLMDDEKYSRVSKTAFEFALGFDMESYIDKLMEIYRQ